MGTDSVETQLMTQGEMENMALSLTESKEQQFEFEIPHAPLVTFTDFEANVFLFWEPF